ncbi:unnamed protein product [Closterium sp. NIES-64]|nr:unnamed protein product [Closterium sp. NIES-64]
MTVSDSQMMASPFKRTSLDLRIRHVKRLERQPSANDVFSHHHITVRILTLAPRAPVQLWDTAFALQDGNRDPPANITLPAGVPFPPHLEHCSRRTAFRLASESRSSPSEDPAWAVPHARCSDVPQPPWVRGPDAALLTATRRVQTDLWLHQFPRNHCHGRRLLLVPWLLMRGHGVGSQLHVLSAVLSIAIMFNRTLVLMPGSFAHADHAACERLGAKGSLRCYFFPVVSRECEAIALEAHRAWQAAHNASKATPGEAGATAAGAEAAGAAAAGAEAAGAAAAGAEAAGAAAAGAEAAGAAAAGAEAAGAAAVPCYEEACLASDAAVLFSPLTGLGADINSDVIHYLHRKAPRVWGSNVFLKRLLPNELMDAMAPNTPTRRQVHWWRSQALRFMLRWPTAYLCHLTNRERHHVYGMEVAQQLVASQQEQAQMLQRAALFNASTALNTSASSEGLPLAEVPGGAAGSAWQGDGYQGCSWDAAATSSDRENGSSGSSSKSEEPMLSEANPFLETYKQVGGEVYIPRPILSLHLRQGDKAAQMPLFSFYSTMFLANRIRRLNPFLRYVWLSTEMEGAVKKSAQFTGWTFFYSKIHRQSSNEVMSKYIRDSGMEQAVGTSFANLLIASECDYFVGVLASNWNRLINELKNTNGRFYSGYSSLNDSEW